LHVATERQNFTRRCGRTRRLHHQNFYIGRFGVTSLPTYVTSDLKKKFLLNINITDY